MNDVCLSMKILLVLDGFGSGGAQRQMVNLAAGLLHRGHTVEFAIYHPEMRHLAPAVEALGIPVHTVRRNPRFPLSVAFGIRTLIRRHRYDNVLAFMETPSLYCELALLGIRRTKLAVSERSGLPAEGRTFTLRVLHEFHRLADWITVNSHHHREHMIQLYPWMARKCSTIYNGVDPSEFAPLAEHAPDSAGKLALLSIGTIIPRKNLPGLIQALAVYGKRYGEPPSVTWVGKIEASLRGRRAYAEANALLHDLDLEHAWHWFGERSDILELINAYDALIHTSFLEGLPNAVCEALACARPVLVSNVCDHALLVRDGISGFLFDPHNPDEIAAAIYRFKRLDQVQREQMGRQALEYARRELSLDTYVESYERLFRDLHDTQR